MKEPIHLCDVHVFDKKDKRKKVLREVLLVGNDKDLIEKHEYFYNKICLLMGYTPVKLKKAIHKRWLSIEKIEFKKFISMTNKNAGWNTTTNTH